MPPPSRTTSRSAVSARQKLKRSTDAGSDRNTGIHLTHPEKVLYPDNGITKQELADYFEAIAPYLLPHLLHRPLVIVRCPDGAGASCFYQKHPGAGTPSQLRQIPIVEKSKTGKYLLVDDQPGLISLAQVAALELHAWGSREDKLDQPDRLIFDLDPSPEVPWEQVIEAAREIRAFLLELGLKSFVKTTGGKGLHLVVPIQRRHTWEVVKPFCKAVAEAIEQAAPDKYTSNLSKAARTDKIFVDYLRNGRGATAIIPYSPRAHVDASVSVPLTWDELSPQIHSNHFTIRNVLGRVNALKKDPWDGFDSGRQTLTAPIRHLKQITDS